jgi:hypothetical protein
VERKEWDVRSGGGGGGGGEPKPRRGAPERGGAYLNGGIKPRIKQCLTHTTHDTHPSTYESATGLRPLSSVGPGRPSTAPDTDPRDPHTRLEAWRRRAFSRRPSRSVAARK